MRIRAAQTTAVTWATQERWCVDEGRACSATQQLPSAWGAGVIAASRLGRRLKNMAGLETGNSGWIGGLCSSGWPRRLAGYQSAEAFLFGGGRWRARRARRRGRGCCGCCGVAGAARRLQASAFSGQGRGTGPGGRRCIRAKPRTKLQRGPRRSRKPGGLGRRSFQGRPDCSTSAVQVQCKCSCSVLLRIQSMQCSEGNAVL